MHFVYFLALCFAANVPIPVQTTIIITGNLKDFRSLVKKFSQDTANSVETVSESDTSTYTDEQTDDTVENKEDSQQNQQHDISGVIAELIKHIGKEPSKKNHVQLTSKKPPTILHLDDVVEKVKLKLLQEILAKSSDARKVNAVANSLVRTAHEEQTQLPSPVVNNDVSNKSTELDVEGRLVQTPAPMTVVKEEVQFEATYEEAPDKDVDLQTQNLGEDARSKKKMKGKKEHGTKNAYPVKNKSVKKVRFVKQVVVPANLNQEQPSIVQQPRLNQQPMVQQPYSNPQVREVVEQPNLVRQLSMMQHQIDQINKTAQQKLTKETEDKVQNTEEVNSKSVAEGNGSEEQIADENAEGEDEPAPNEEVEDNDKEQVEGTAEDEQPTEDIEPAQETTGTGEEEETTPGENEEETTPGENEEDNTADGDETTPSEMLRNKVDKVDSDAKIPTKDFGTVDTEKLIKKTNDFNGTGESDAGPYNFNLTLDDAFPGARKVMLF